MSIREPWVDEPLYTGVYAMSDLDRSDSIFEKEKPIDWAGSQSNNRSWLTRRRIAAQEKERSEKSHKFELQKLHSEVKSFKEALEFYRESDINRERESEDVFDYFKERFPDFDDAAPRLALVSYVRQVVDHLDAQIDLSVILPRNRNQVVLAIDKLSGDLNYDNIAAAKEILKGVLGE